MGISIQQTLKSAGRYAASNPRVLGQIARFAFQRQLAIPLDSLRWLVANMPLGKKAPTDITITGIEPAIGLGATADVMGTSVRIDAAVHIDKIDAAVDDLVVTLRLNDLRASVLNNLDGNLAKLLKSGVLKLGKPASLLSMIPKKPKFIVDAKDDRFVLDLMKIDAVRNNPTIQKALRTLTPVLTIGRIRTEGDLLLIGLTPHPAGIRQAFAGFRGQA